jgi:hypothetical protein
MSEKPKKSVESAIRVLPGVSIYKVENSRFWYVRVWDREKKRYVVKGTKETSSIAAKKLAQDLAVTLLQKKKPSEREFSFKTYALRLIKKEEQVTAKGDRSVGSFKAMKWCLYNDDWGLIKRFGDRDVREITTGDFRTYMDYLDEVNPEWAPSTKNTILATFRNVLKVAREDSVIDAVPDTPRSRQRDNPRPFFRFHPLVPKKDDAYKKVLETAKKMEEDEEVIRWIPVTDELYDLILFVTHTFVRPIASELYALRHRDITIAEDPKRLIINIRDGKTGYRVSNSMPGAVAVYKRTRERNPEKSKPTDFIFLPDYPNRATASRIIQRQFKRLMELSDLETDTFTGQKHSLYSLRHTAICMRIILSEGQVNIFNLAKNAGTSVDQIERFYARNLPLSGKLAKNLQSFGSS